MDSTKWDGIQLHKPDDGYYNYTLSNNGLYPLPLTSLSQAKDMWLFVTTISKQAEKYTNCQVEAAKRARSMQNIIMHPSDHQLTKSAIRYLPANCPVLKMVFTLLLTCMV